MTPAQEQTLLELLWDYMKRDPEHKDRVRTGWGTKTQQGLIASIERIVKRDYSTEDQLAQAERAQGVE